WLGITVGGTSGSDLSFDYSEETSQDIYFSDGLPIVAGSWGMPTEAVPLPEDGELDGHGDWGLSGGYDIQRGDVVFGVGADFLQRAGGQSRWSTGTVSVGDSLITRDQELSATGGLDKLATIRGRMGIAID